MKRKLSLLAMLATIVLVVAVTVGHSATGHTEKFPKKARIVVPYILSINSTLVLPDLPPDVPIQITGVCNTLGLEGVGQVTLHRVAGSEVDSFLEWVGSDYANGESRSQGSTPGLYIIALDNLSQVVLEVNSLNSVRVHNLHDNLRCNGTITITW